MQEAETKGPISFHTSFTEDIVQVEIRDNGPGIPEENRETIFNPFSPPRSRGKAPGLA